MKRSNEMVRVIKTHNTSEVNEMHYEIYLTKYEDYIAEKRYKCYNTDLKIYPYKWWEFLQRFIDKRDYRISNKNYYKGIAKPLKSNSELRKSLIAFVLDHWHKIMLVIGTLWLILKGNK
jgi:hypothetical protein